MFKILICLLMVGVITAAAQEEKKVDTLEEKADTLKEGGVKMAMTITSTAFEESGMIPSKFTCDGDDISPALSWNGVPEKTKSLALICDDPDAPAGTWVHWVIYNIPPDTGGFPENIPADEKLKNGAGNGTNSWGKFGYGGPCPPGGTHRYYFKLYALDTMLDLSGKIGKKDLLKAMEEHILAEAQLMGKYKRK